MSDTDSFIEEVTEEVRKDQLYGYFKKYGWIAGALIVLIVGGAVYSEWSNHRAAVDAQARGDALAAALNKPTAAEQIAALDNISAKPGDATDLLKFQRAAILVEDGQMDAAITLLNAIASDETAKQIYRDMARFKAVVLSGNDMDQGERMAVLEVLAKPGNAFRPLALEQIAVAKLDAGDVSGAIELLTQVLNEPDISADLRRRSAQLLVSLGGEIPAVSQLLSGSETAQ
jgi:hypothetical protein